MSAGKIILLVFGVVILLISIGLLFAGGTLMWVDQTHIDSMGFIRSSTMNIERDSHAVITGPIAIDEVAMNVLDWMGVVTDFNIEGRSNDPLKGIFIGVADKSDVDTYLNNVTYDEITFIDLSWQLSIDKVLYTNHLGYSSPLDPSTKTFWRASAYGIGNQILEWKTEAGKHAIVLMNDDGSSDVDLSIIFKVKVPSIFGLSLGLIIGGVVLLIIAGLMVYFAVRRSKITAGAHA
jgi:hypothetical protein